MIDELSPLGLYEVEAGISTITPPAVAVEVVRGSNPTDDHGNKKPSYIH